MLIAKGNLSLLNRESIAIVGSRSANVNSHRFTKKLVNELCAEKLIIVSGMARGIDTTAHDAVLRNDLINDDCGTIAVLGNGINIVYPQENKKLYDQIADNGLLVTEFVCDVMPLSANFPQRNRIISGLSMGVVVIEAKKSSGSLITANYALEQGRDVFAVPGFPGDINYSGGNNLIKNGAILVDSVDDILNVIQFSTVKPIINLFDLDENFVDQNKHYITPDLNKVDHAKKLILDCLGSSSSSIEELISFSKLSVNIITTAILELELAQKIERTGTGRIMKLL
jgi:DNA processing protein